MDMYQRQDDDRQRVKDASDIVRVVGEHVSLKPKGREFVGLCPFHDDRNPSMAVVPAKQIFHCFVCGTGGDVYSFVQKYHSMDFREAIEFLAQRSGIELTKRQPKREPLPGELPGINKADILRANDTAQGFFKAILNHPEHGVIARGLIERREISPEMVEAFGIGASPDRWDGLLVTIEGKKLDPRAFDAAGLLKTRDSGGRYDALRNRLIFPIHDQIGRVIAFGGRRIDDDDDPKYLNSPETPAFRKNTTLYGISQASRSIQQKRTAVVVEGYTDVVACHQAGVTNVVGTLGTALTGGHATVLRRLCDTVVLLFDGDTAGQKAADRAVEVLFSEQLDIRVASFASLTDAKDPDEVLKLEGGREIFEQAIANAKDLLAWKFERLRVSLSDKGPAAVANAVEEELDRFTRLGMSRLSPVRRRQLVRLISEATGIDEATIQRQIKTGRSGPTFDRTEQDPQGPTARRGEQATGRELVLGCLMTDGSLWLTMTGEQQDSIRVDAFKAPESSLLADTVLRVGSDGDRPTLDAVLAELDPEEPYAEQASAWAVSLARTAEERTLGHPERLRRLFDECLRAAGFEDESAQAVDPKPSGQQSTSESAGGSQGSGDDAAALGAFIERQRALREKFGRPGVTRLGEE
ncbi:MAG: DNA primase [Phycisphaerales bacterium]